MKMLVSDIDGTLLGGGGLDRFLQWHDVNKKDVIFAVSTGRTFESALESLEKNSIFPDAIVSSIGTQIHIRNGQWEKLPRWEEHLSHGWCKDNITRALEGFGEPLVHEEGGQSPFKISLRVFSPHLALRIWLKLARMGCQCIYSHGRHLDIVPIAAGKGGSLKALARTYGATETIACGDSKNDLDMLTAAHWGIVVANHELDVLRENRNVYFAEAEHANGIIEGLGAYENRNSIHWSDKGGGIQSPNHA
jgi:sucrose-phosphate synthase